MGYNSSFNRKKRNININDYKSLHSSRSRYGNYSIVFTDDVEPDIEMGENGSFIFKSDEGVRLELPYSANFGACLRLYDFILSRLSHEEAIIYVEDFGKFFADRGIRCVSIIADKSRYLPEVLQKHKEYIDVYDTIQEGKHTSDMLTTLSLGLLEKRRERGRGYLKHRRAVLDLNDWKCVDCSIDLTLETAHIDHKFPQSKWNEDVKYLNDISNLQAMCQFCNDTKYNNIRLQEKLF